MELYTRFSIKKMCIGGFLAIPKGTICRTDNNMIYFKDKIVCRANSETAKNFCENTPDAIKKADLLDILIPMTPKYPHLWTTYGEMGPFCWQWYESVLTLPNGNLEYLISKLKSEV